MAELSGGGFVIGWEDTGQDGNGLGVYYQQYNAAGGVVGTETRLDSITTGDQQLEAIEGTADGGFMVVWRSDSIGSDTYYMKRFDAAGNQVSNKVELPIANNETPSGIGIDISTFADGSFMAVWEGITVSDINVHGQRFSADGNPQGAAFIVNEYTSSTQEHVETAILADGRMVAVWQSWNVQGGAGNAWEIRARVYNPITDSWGNEFTASSASAFHAGFDRRPEVAAMPDGGFIVVWQSNAIDGNGEGVIGERFDANHNKMGQFQVNTTTAGHQQLASVTPLDDGGFLVTWTDTSGNDGDSHGMYAQRFDASNLPVGDETILNETTASYQISDGMDNLVTLSDGKVVVTWLANNGINAELIDIHRPIFEDVQLAAFDEDKPLVITPAMLLANTTDPDGDPLFVIGTPVLLNPEAGTLTDNGNGTWTFIPKTDYHANNVAFSFIGTDGNTAPETLTARVNISAISDVEPDTYVINEDESITFNLLENDTFEGTVSTVEILNSPANGILTPGSALGEFVFTPNENWSGNEAPFVYQVTTDDGLIEQSTFSLAVTPVADAATITLTNEAGDEDTAISLDFT